MTDLLPCPFCGNAATYAYNKTRGWKAECEGRWGTCTINARTHYQPNKAQATDAWNRRTAHSSIVKVNDKWEAIDEEGNDNFATSIYEAGWKGLLVARCNQNGRYPWQAAAIIRGLEKNKELTAPAEPGVEGDAKPVAELTYGQKLIAEAIEAHFGEREEDFDEDADDTTNRDVWEAFDALTHPSLLEEAREVLAEIGDDCTGRIDKDHLACRVARSALGRNADATT